MTPQPSPHSRAALYIRQSQTSDDTISPELQEQHCRELAKREGYVVVGVYSDIDISGRKMGNRPELLRLRTDYDAGKFDVALADDYSRFSRNMADGAHIIGSMPVGTYKEGIHQGDDDFIPMIHLLLAHKYSQDMSKRWRDAHTYRLERGLPPNGIHIFGYDKLNSAGQVISGKGQGSAAKYVPNKDADLVRELYQKYTQGVGAIPLVEQLNRDEVPTLRGEEWQTAQLFRLLDNPFYVGNIVWAGEEWPGTHEPIITEAEWLAFKKVRDARRTKRNPPNPKWLLAGLVKCPHCGGAMVATTIREKKILTCSTNNNKGKSACIGLSRSLNWVLDGFFSWLMIFQMEIIDDVPESKAQREKLEKAIQEADLRKDKAQEKLTKLQGMALEMGWNMDQVREANKPIQIEFEEAERTRTEALEELGTMGHGEADDMPNIFYKVLNGLSTGADGELDLQGEAQFRQVLSRKIEKIVPRAGFKGGFDNRRSIDEIEIHFKDGRIY